MGMIRNHLKQMRVEDPKEYRRLMEGFDSEDELVREVCNLSTRAANYAKSLMGVANSEKRRK